MTTSGPNMFERNRFSRRRFMQYGAVGTGIVAVSPYLSKLQAFAAPPVADHEGILVTINLAGGNDGLNMVIPYADPQYPHLRSSLRVTNSLHARQRARAAPGDAEAEGALRPGQGRGRARRRLQAAGPQPLHVGRHLDARVGRQQCGDAPDGSGASSTACRTPRTSRSTAFRCTAT